MKQVLKKLWSGSLTFLLIVLFIILGAANTVFVKVQNEVLSKGCNTKPPQAFTHPLFQTALLLLGLAFFTPFYIIEFCNEKLKKKKTAQTPPTRDDPEIQHRELLAAVVEVVDQEEETPDQEKEKKKIKPSPLLIILPAFFGVSGAVLLIAGLMLTFASVYQMLYNNLKIVSTAILASIFLRRRLLPHHILGMAIVVMGGILIALSSLQDSKFTNREDASSPITGALLILAGQLGISIEAVLEEWILTQFDCTVLKCLSFEGIWGTMISFLFMGVFFPIPGYAWGDWVMSFPEAICQAGTTVWILPVLFCCTLGVVGLFNLVALVTVKRIGATNRSIVDCLRTVLVWVVQLVRGRDTFTWMELVGCLLLFIGTFLYNEIIQIPLYVESAFATGLILLTTQLRLSFQRIGGLRKTQYLYPISYFDQTSSCEVFEVGAMRRCQCLLSSGGKGVIQLSPDGSSLSQEAIPMDPVDPGIPNDSDPLDPAALSLLSSRKCYTCEQIGPNKIAIGCRSCHSPRIAVVGDQGEIRVVGKLTGSALMKIRDDEVTGLAYVPASDLLVSCSSQKHIAVWDLKREESLLDDDDAHFVCLLEGHKGWVHDVDIDSEVRPNIVVSVCGDRTARVWDLSRLKCLSVMSEVHTFPIETLCHDSEREIQFLGSNDKTVSCWDYRTATKFATLGPFSHWVETLSYRESNSQLFVPCYKGGIHLVDARMLGSENTKTATLRTWQSEHNNYIFDSCYVEDRDVFVSTGCEDRTVVAWREDNGTVLWRWASGHQKCYGLNEFCEAESFGSSGEMMEKFEEVLSFLRETCPCDVSVVVLESSVGSVVKCWKWML